MLDISSNALLKELYILKLQTTALGIIRMIWIGQEKTLKRNIDSGEKENRNYFEHFFLLPIFTFKHMRKFLESNQNTTTSKSLSALGVSCHTSEKKSSRLNINFYIYNISYCLFCWRIIKYSRKKQVLWKMCERKIYILAFCDREEKYLKK